MTCGHVFHTTCITSYQRARGCPHLRDVPCPNCKNTADDMDDMDAFRSGAIYDPFAPLASPEIIVMVDRDEFVADTVIELGGTVDDDAGVGALADWIANDDRVCVDGEWLTPEAYHMQTQLPDAAAPSTPAAVAMGSPMHSPKAPSKRKLKSKAGAPSAPAPAPSAPAPKAAAKGKAKSKAMIAPALAPPPPPDDPAPNAAAKDKAKSKVATMAAASRKAKSKGTVTTALAPPPDPAPSAAAKGKAKSKATIAAALAPPPPLAGPAPKAATPANAKAEAKAASQAKAKVEAKANVEAKAATLATAFAEATAPPTQDATDAPPTAPADTAAAAAAAADFDTIFGGDDAGDDDKEPDAGTSNPSTAMMVFGKTSPGVAQQFENSFLCEACNRYQTLDKVLSALLSGVTNAARSGTTR